MKQLSASLIVLFSLIILTTTVSYVYGAHDEIPRIPIEELKKLVDEKADHRNLRRADKSGFLTGHIKGAVSFPWKSVLEDADIRLLPKGKDTFIIVYCDLWPW